MSENTEIQGKPRIKSRTHWFNAVMAGLTTLEANLHVIQSLIHVDSYKILTITLIVGNVILRELTKGPVQ